MSDTLLGVIIGGVIGVVSTAVQTVITFFMQKKDSRENNKKEYRDRKLLAYQLLLDKINDMENMKKAKDFDFYYSRVLPYASDDLRILIDDFYNIFFEPNFYQTKSETKINFDKRKGEIVGDINELVRIEIQLMFHPHRKKKIRLVRYDVNK